MSIRWTNDITCGKFPSDFNSLALNAILVAIVDCEDIKCDGKDFWSTPCNTRHVSD